jgi:hypothetical protein
VLDFARGRGRGVPGGRSSPANGGVTLLAVVARKGGHDRERRGEERGRECTEKEIGLQGLLFIYASETVFFLAHTKKANSPAGQPKCILFSITSVLRFKIIYFTIFQRYSMYPTKGNMERTT